MFMYNANYFLCGFLNLLKILRGLLKSAYYAYERKKEQFSFAVQAGGSKDLMKTESQEEKILH